MWNLILARYNKYKRDLLSPNFDTFRITVMKLIIIFGAFTSIIFSLSQTTLDVFSGQGIRPDHLLVNILEFTSALIFLLLLRVPYIKTLVPHIILGSMILISCWYSLSYGDLYSFGTLSCVAVFAAGFITRPLYSWAYFVFSCIAFYFLTIPRHFNPINYISYYSLIAVATIYAYIISRAHRTTFLQKEKNNEKIRQLYESDKRLFSNLAHRLKTPLTILQTQFNLDTGKKRTKQDDQIAETIREISKAIAELTIISKMNLSKISASTQQVNLAVFMKSVISDAEILAKNYEKTHGVARNITYKEESFTQPPIVYISSEKLREAILNLIDNSIRHSPDSRVVNISVDLTAKGNYYMITLIDDGVGMTDERLRQVLSNKASSQIDSGQHTHVGLQITRNIIRADGGTINIYSRPDQGTTIEVLLPKS